MGKPTRHGDKWRMRWKDEAGRRRSRVFPSYQEAAEFGYCREEEAVRQQRLREQTLSTTVTFKQLSEHWLVYRCPEKRSAKDDRSILRRHLLPFFGAMPVNGISTADIQRFAVGLNLSPKTVHNLLTLLAAMLREAYDHGWIQKLPRIRKPKISFATKSYNYLRTPEEVARFLQAAKSVDEELHALYATAIYTGMRQGELAGLKWEDVDLKTRLLCVQRSFNGPTKSDAIRYVPILDPLLPLLQARKVGASSDYVFPTETGTMQQPSARVFQEKLHKVLLAAEFGPVLRQSKLRPYITFHGLRHTFASHWMMNGGDIFRLQRIGGWQSFAMVQRYAHLAPDAFSSDYKRMSNLENHESS